MSSRLFKMLLMPKPLIHFRKDLMLGWNRTEERFTVKVSCASLDLSSHIFW